MSQLKRAKYANRLPRVWDGPWSAPQHLSSHPGGVLARRIMSLHPAISQGKLRCCACGLFMGSKQHVVLHECGSSCTWEQQEMEGEGLKSCVHAAAGRHL